MDKQKFLKTGKLLLKTGFTALLVYLVFQKIDFAQVSQTLGRSNPFYLFLALVLYACSQVVSSWRLLGFLRVLELPLTFVFNLKLYLLGMFYNVFLPGGVGGDGYKIYLLRKKFNTPAKKLVFGLLLDRACGLWAISLIAAGLAFFLPVLKLAWWIPALYIAVAIAGFFLLWRLFFRMYIGYFATAAARALFVQSIQCAAVICILRALHADGSYLPYLFSFLLSTIATVIPFSVGGLGLREYVMVQLSPVLFLHEATAVSTSLCFYIISTVAALPGIWFVYRSAEFAPAPDEAEKKAVLDDSTGG